jgi:hypothetical protein
MNLNLGTMNRICLNMIVKDEAEIIIDTFDNLRLNFSFHNFIISDTGSKDNTIILIKEYCSIHKIKLEIHNDTWVNFGHNRNLALSHCKGKSDYILFFDADDRIQGNIHLPPLTADIYLLRYRSASSDGFFHYRKGLIKNTVAKWIGVLHESIVPLHDNLSESLIDGDYYVQTGHFGSRSKDPEKYLKDAKICEDAFIIESSTSKLKARYAHYCATSHFSHGNIDQSIDWFKTRIELSNISDDLNEEYLSHYYLGIAYKESNQLENAFNTWLSAWDKFPQKIEFIYEASQLQAEKKNYRLAYKIALWGIEKIRLPIDNNFCFEENIYKYGISYLISRYGLLCGYYDLPLQELIHISKQAFYSKELIDHVIESLHKIINANVIIEWSLNDIDSLFHYISDNDCNLKILRDELITYFLNTRDVLGY